MNFKTIVKKLLPNFLINQIRARGVQEGIEQFTFRSNAALEVKTDIQEKYGHESELLNIYANNTGAIVHKWHHYIPIYDRYFSPFRNRKIRFLEIGVSEGGSLQMWRKYFGDDAIIFGIDINPKCEKFNGIAGQVRIGSQTDHVFLASVIKEMGGVDVILDDGSHDMQHIPVTLEYLFPHMNYGGIYMIEDLHTAYWKGYSGGYRSKRNFFRYAMDLIDDMHHWYHNNDLKQALISKDCSGIHVHDSILVLEKNKVYEPTHSQVS
jgi:hypothetical protein